MNKVQAIMGTLAIGALGLFAANSASKNVITYDHNQAPFQNRECTMIEGLKVDEFIGQNAIKVAKKLK